MKINPIFAIVAFISGMIATLTLLSSPLNTTTIISLTGISLSSLFGLLGIYLFEKNYKIAIIQYVLCGILLLSIDNIFELLASIFFILAAIIAYIEREKVEDNLNNFDASELYLNKEEIENRYPNFPKNYTPSKYIPLLSIILILSIAFTVGGIYELDNMSKADSIKVTDLSYNLNTYFGYTMGSQQLTITSDRDFDLVTIQGVWYDENNTIIDKTYDSNLVKKLQSGQKYQANIPYYQQATKKPTKIELQILEPGQDKPFYNETLYFNET